MIKVNSLLSGPLGFYQAWGLQKTEKKPIPAECWRIFTRTYPSIALRVRLPKVWGLRERVEGALRLATGENKDEGGA